MDLLIKILINNQSQEKHIEMRRHFQIFFLVFKKGHLFPNDGKIQEQQI